jgi:hypothetical protein
MYGEAGLRSLLEAPSERDAGQLVAAIFDDVSAFAAGFAQSDDITVAVLDIAQ